MGDDKADCAVTTTETACCVAQNCAWAWPLNGGWGACTGVSPNLSQSRSQVCGPARTVNSAGKGKTDTFLAEVARELDPG